MKKAQLLCSLVLILGILKAQTPVSDSIDLGPGSPNMVFYNLATQSKTSASATDWDLQFGTTFMGASIRTNDGRSPSVALYKPQNSDTTNWGYPVDTANMTRLYNSDSTWDKGAFNTQHLTCSQDIYNFGWGCYDDGTHNVTGSVVFVIKTINGNFKQIWVRKLVGTTNTYEIKLAELDGSNPQTVSIDRNPYSAKSSFYYAIDSNDVKDIEPQKTEWDLIFRKYETFVNVPPQPAMFYVVTGVLSNGKGHVAEARNVNVSSNDYSAYNFESDISTIGWDWKTFNGTSYDIEDSLAYFVWVQDSSNVYKLVFTGFGQGKAHFNKTQLSPPATAISEISNIRALTISPNPTIGNVQAVFTLKSESDVKIDILDLSGKSHLTTHTQASRGLNILTLNTAELAQGFYLLSVDDGNNRLTYKLVKN